MGSGAAKHHHEAEPKPIPGEKHPSHKCAKEVPAGRTPVVIVSCGSFSPPTNMHLRLLEEAKDAMNADSKYHVIGGLLSPVHDGYGKKSLVPMEHRVAMVEASTQASSWLAVDAWESKQDGYTLTALVLDDIRQHFDTIEVKVGDDDAKAGLIKVVFVCGADLLESFGAKKDDGSWVWAPEHREIILDKCGVVCMERAGTPIQEFIANDEILSKYKDNITLMQPTCENAISSTVIRKLLQQGKSITYLIPDAARDYIYKYELHKMSQWQ
mmetsp:Transcript_104503/g.239456  ORF Transcript_104503/g.239456 Transcript_104503/m.239456 type:complete len:269 (+) Transcript_104503:77-883(+)